MTLPTTHDLIMMLIGMVILFIWQEIYKAHEAKKLANYTMKAVFFNTFDDHGICNRGVTEEFTNEGHYPNFSAWSGDWFVTSSYPHTESRWYIGMDYGRYQAYRKVTFITAYRHDDQ